MEKENKFLILCVLVLIISSLAFALVIISKESYLDKSKFETSFEISDKVGFDVNKTALTFGKLIPASSSTRSILFTNEYDFPVRVEIISEGEISPYLEFEKYLIVEKKETKKISITAVVPENIEKRFYRGNITIITREND